MYITYFPLGKKSINKKKDYKKNTSPHRFSSFLCLNDNEIRLNFPSWFLYTYLFIPMKDAFSPLKGKIKQ